MDGGSTLSGTDNIFSESYVIAAANFAVKWEFFGISGYSLSIDLSSVVFLELF